MYLLIFILILTFFFNKSKTKYIEHFNGIQLTSVPAFFINLERRKDRLDTTIPLLHKHGFHNITIVKAIDASDNDASNRGIKGNEILKFVHPNHLQPILDNKRTSHSQLSKGAVGCTLSHFKCFQKFKRLSHNIAFVFEDDVLPKSHIKYLQQQLYTLPRDWDIILIGGLYDKNNVCIDNKNLCKVSRFYQTHAYIINKNKLDFLLKNGIPIRYQIDSWMSDLSQKGLLNVYGLVKQPWNVNDAINQTDIQTLLQIQGT